MPETSAIHLNGSGAVASFGFSADAIGSSTYIDTVLSSLAISNSGGSFASSSVRIISIASGASGENTLASASAWSTASAD